MNWYKKAQFINEQLLVQSIVARLNQARDGWADIASTIDDIHTKGYDPMHINNAIDQAIRVVAEDGTEGSLTDSQREIVRALRGNRPGMPNTVITPNEQQVTIPSPKGDGFSEHANDFSSQ